jgi:hypothetical protein
MAGALEIMHARRVAAAKNQGGAPSNKAIRPTSQLPGLPIASSRFSSKGARAKAIEAKLVETDFAGVTPSGQQDRFTIEDVTAIVDAKAKAAKDADDLARETEGGAS